MRDRDSSRISGSLSEADLQLFEKLAPPQDGPRIGQPLWHDVNKLEVAVLMLVDEVRRQRDELANEEREYDKLDTRAAEHARAEGTLRRKYGDALVHIEALCAAGQHVIDSEGGSEDEHQAFGELRAAMKAAGR